MADPIIHPIVNTAVIRPVVVEPHISESGLTGATGPQGPMGPVPIHVGPTPPSDTSLLWVDTTI